MLANLHPLNVFSINNTQVNKPILRLVGHQKSYAKHHLVFGRISIQSTVPGTVSVEKDKKRKMWKYHHYPR